ncbi:3-hydroxyacyl-ACP dehydratase FabZ [Fodinicurvata sp. EGI_FJ10296]|jgi:beta-hydroxyacyl-ACP dehydratase FabZ|uniref:3-hydroxyacyl-ACP dehydratase FabZ n=1 Tax=Fodinicurvata sp. EGI_FJ10296 TaxID=3231908 RepID=UPI0034548D99
MSGNEVIFDSAAIMRLLPHRYPFLLIDKIIEVGDDHAVAVKNVTVNEPYFQGHFPGQPIVPGVLLAETMVQTAAFIGRTPESVAEEGGKQRQFFLAAVNMRLRKPAVPGDQMVIRMAVQTQMGDLRKVRGEIKAGRDTLVTGDFNIGSRE